MRIELPSGTPAEVVLPDGEPTRGLVVAPDIFGLRPLFDDLCARLARERGYAVCAVEPFPGQQDLDIEGRMGAVPELVDDDKLADLVAAADHLGTGATTAVLGFCMGGMYAFKAAGIGRFDKAVAFYGMIRLPAHFRGPGQREPLDYLARAIASPTLAIIGDKDPYTPPEDVAALEALGPHISTARYADAEHGFVHDPERPAHRPADAADAWSRVYAFLD